MQLLFKVKNKYSILIKPLKLFFQRLFFWLSIPFIISCSNTNTFAQSQTNLKTHSYNYPILPQGKNTEITSQFMQINLLGSIALKSIKVNSLLLSELSGIAWDNDEQLLYAVSDEGLLYHLKLTLKEGRLESMQATLATRLKNKNGKKLSGKYSDSEGLSLINGNNGKRGDSQLIISFENKPRIVYYSPKGKFLHKVKLPKNLKKRKHYRHKNKALESVTIHPKYGILTASEYPLKVDKLNYQSLYSDTGEIWHFEASQATNSAITGLETLPNGDIMILERAYQNPIIPITINLRRLKLEQCNKKRECETEIIASFNGGDGWLLDNFEGLAHLKDNQYLMVSDNNENPLQRTILVLFEVN